MTLTAPQAVLVCRPAHFDVIDVKNPFMQGSVPVDRARAMREWLALRSAFSAAGLEPVEIAPLRDAEDMVFTANPAFAGLDAQGQRVAIASRMKFESRRREVAPTAQRLTALGYRVDLSIPRELLFEGGGDAIWHPFERRIYCGYGWRTDERALPFIERAFGAEVVPLRLVDPRFYHLDTAMCALDNTTVLIVAEAFEAQGLRTIGQYFARVLELDAGEALSMAANAASNWRGTVIIDPAASKTAASLRRLGYTIVPVETGEFRKSGGSVYCMKQYLF